MVLLEVLDVGSNVGSPNVTNVFSDANILGYPPGNLFWARLSLR